MINCLGKFLRKIRINNGEILRTMAEKLDVSSAFLSAIENGKKKMPNSLIQKLQEIYNLSSEQIEELKNAILESSDTVEINVKDAPFETRQLAFSFARQFDTLDEETSKDIFILLKKHSQNRRENE